MTEILRYDARGTVALAVRSTSPGHWHDDGLEPAARHVTEQYANNRIEADHGRLTARLRAMRGLTQVSSAKAIAAGHAFVQNLRRGHYELTADVPAHDRVRVVFVDLALSL